MAPNSHINGRLPICGVFASPGVNCSHAMIAQHGFGIGDHRVHLFDFDAQALLGESYPSLVAPTGRKLVCTIDRIRLNYENVLLQLVERHRMLEKIATLDELQPRMPAPQFQLMFNRWDNELRDYILAAEKRCRKFRMNHLPWSPVVGMWMRRLKLYKWLEAYCRGKVPDWRNLKRSCTRQGLRCPSSYTLDEVLLKIHSCMLNLEKERENAPKMRREHLQDRLDIARLRGDVASEQEIIRIIKREAEKAEYTRLRIFTGKPRSSPPVSVTITNSDGA
eukprot:scaffold4257_cov80-Skeletonema_dohrnii-CCMP3373.AAC.1